MTLPDLVAPRPCPQGDVPELRDLPAPAKLNLFLHITGRRDDGYHLCSRCSCLSTGLTAFI